MLMLMAPSRLLRRVVDEIILYYRMDNESTHFQSYQYLSDSDDSDTHIRSEIPRLSCDQPSIGSLTGVLYTSPTPVSLWVPIQAWPGWAPLLLSTEIVPDDACLNWFGYGVPAS